MSDNPSTPNGSNTPKPSPEETFKAWMVVAVFAFVLLCVAIGFFAS